MGLRWLTATHAMRPRASCVVWAHVMANCEGTHTAKSPCTEKRASRRLRRTRRALLRTGLHGVSTEEAVVCVDDVVPIAIDMCTASADGALGQGRAGPDISSLGLTSI